jgi:hypothetical protein
MNVHFCFDHFGTAEDRARFATRGAVRARRRRAAAPAHERQSRPPAPHDRFRRQAIARRRPSDDRSRHAGGPRPLIALATFDVSDMGGPLATP